MSVAELSGTRTLPAMNVMVVMELRCFTRSVRKGYL